MARNTPELRRKAEEYQAGEITREEYDYADSLKRSELSNMAFYIQSLGEIVILAIIVGILFSLHVNSSTANNNWGLSVLIAFGTGAWLLLAIPWFLKEKRRAGQQVLHSDLLQMHAVDKDTDPTRYEHCNSRILAALPCPPPDLAPQTVSHLPHRILPSRRLTQYNGHRNRHSPKQSRVL